MNSPVVSVILPVFNGANYLRFAIESVLNQTLRDFELIVVDDGSTDSTPDIARSYGTRLKYIRKDNGGVATAFNRGIQESSGRYISWISHDDVFHLAKLEKQVAVLTRMDTPAACYTDVELIDEAGSVIAEVQLPEYGPGEILRHVLSHEAIGMACYSLCYDRRCVEEVGLYSEYWRYTQDADMLARLARRFPLVRVSEPLVQIREHESRGIRAVSWQQEVVKFYRDHIAGVPAAELFPGSDSRAQRSRAYLSLGDDFAAKEFPLYRVAYSQYLRALRENPVNVLTMLRRIVGLYRYRGRQEPRG
jgi:glycosyltransferase involved in cell wall biosynthesis